MCVVFFRRGLEEEYLGDAPSIGISAPYLLCTATMSRNPNETLNLNPNPTSDPTSDPKTPTPPPLLGSSAAVSSMGANEANLSTDPTPDKSADVFQSHKA